MNKISENKRLLVGLSVAFVASSLGGYYYGKSLDTNKTLNLQETMKYAKNSSDMVAGYNVIQGNPLAVGEHLALAEGFRAPVFQYQLSEEMNYSGYYQAEGYYTVASDECTGVASEKLFTGLTSYANFAYSYAGFYVGFCGFGFGASTTTKQYQSKFYEEMKILVTAAMSCSVFEMKMQSYGYPEPSENMIRGVATLPETYEEQYYMTFFETMGTHFQAKTVFGAAAYFNAFYDASVYASMYAYEYNHHVSVNLGVFSFGSSTTDASADAQMDKKLSESLTVSIIGASPVGLTTEEWQEKAMNNPRPISYELIPIADLFRTSWMTPYTSKNLDSIYNNLVQAGSGYCEWLELQQPGTVAYCNTPTPDLTLGPGPWMAANNMNGEWQQWLSPQNQTSSIWKVGYQSGYGIVSLAVQTLTGGWTYGPENNNAQTWTTFQVNGMLNYVGAYYQGGYGVVNVQFGWLNNGVQEYSDWAVDNFNGNLNVLTVDDGIFLGLRTNYQGDYGIVNLQAYNCILPADQ